MGVDMDSDDSEFDSDTTDGEQHEEDSGESTPQNGNAKDDV